MDIGTVGTALLAGLLSFLSPCVLPLVPAYISYIAGTGLKEERTTINIFIKSILFVLGFSVIFILLGATATTLSKLFYDYKDILNKLAGIILIILGINLIGFVQIKWLYKINLKIDLTKLKGNSFLIGLAFGLGFTPCVGSILAGILVYASNLETVGLGIGMLIIYSLGVGIPFILTALFINKMIKVLNKVKKYSNIILIVSGILIILIGLLIFTNNLTRVNKYLNWSWQVF